jgi:serine/threonine protein kinase
MTRTPPKGNPRPPRLPAGTNASDRGDRGKLDRTLIDGEGDSQRRAGAGPVGTTGFEAESSRTSVDKLTIGPGLRIEQYELIRELGRGGMGQVFLARDNKLGRRVAMKFLSGSGSKRFTERFLVEARATARCHHENIVAIYAADEYLGVPYMVLEYVEGITLSKLMADKRMPVGRTVEVIVPVL